MVTSRRLLRLGEIRLCVPSCPRIWLGGTLISCNCRPSKRAAPIVNAIRWADENDANVVANYPQADGTPTVALSRDLRAPLSTKEQLEALPNYAEVGMAGFGFVYLNQPIHYVFHADVTGEDVNFWLDNPQIRIHLARDIRLGHQKSRIVW